MKTRKLVLLVDDNISVRALSTGILEGAGYRVVACSSAAEGWEAMREQVPHLILVDILMPGESGLQFLKKCKENPEISAIPVVIFSMIQDRRARDIAAKLGAATYLHKPFTARILLGKALLALKQGHSPSLTFHCDHRPRVNMAIPGRITSSTTGGFVLESPVRIGRGALADVRSPFLAEIGCQDCYFRKTSAEAPLCSSGQYACDLTLVGVGCETLKKGRHA